MCIPRLGGLFWFKDTWLESTNIKMLTHGASQRLKKTAHFYPRSMTKVCEFKECHFPFLVLCFSMFVMMEVSLFVSKDTL